MMQNKTLKSHQSQHQFDDAKIKAINWLNIQNALKYDAQLKRQLYCIQKWMSREIVV